MSSWYTGRREYPFSAKILAISSMESVSSTATMSTLGVRISSTSRSWNSMAARMSLLSCWSRPPSLSAWSTRVTSSSSVMPPSADLRNTLDSSRFHWVNRKFSGVRTVRSTPSSGVANMANRSGDSLARLLGETSPKIRITTVSTMADTVGPVTSSIRWIKSTAPMVVATLLTMLLPISRVESSLS